MLNSWKEFTHCKVPVVKARVEQILRFIKGPDVLEVGCNEGFVAKAVIEEKGCRCIAIDNRDEAIKKCAYYFGIKALKADATNLPFENQQFNTVIGGEILEHVENPGQVLSELFRVSKGRVIITLPLGEYWMGEKTHCYALEGSLIHHDTGAAYYQDKHALVVAFDKRRVINSVGEYVDIK